MDNVIFRFNGENQIVSCMYIEQIDDFKMLSKIELSPEELLKMYYHFKDKYPEQYIISEEYENVKAVTFCDVDYIEMKSYKKQSEAFKKYTKKTSNIESDLPKQKKISRTSPIKRKTIIVLASIVVALSAGIATNSILNADAYQPLTIEQLKNMEVDTGLQFDFEPSNIVEDIDISNKDTNQNQTTQEIIIEPPQEELPETVVTEKVTNSQEIAFEDPEKIDAVFMIEADNLTDTEKYYVANAYYSDAIEKYANMYGIDPKLALAIGTHERGLHSSAVDEGGAIGLFQIQVRGSWNWDGKTITAYNFDTNEYETVTITEEKVSDVFENIKVGCMMLQNLLTKYNYNIALAVTAYNYGDNYLEKVLQKCSECTGFTIEQLCDLNNLEWLSYRDIISSGDPLYLENVCKYIPNETVLKFKIPGKENLTIKYENLNYKKDITK